nr:hypothetical protein Iba_chr02cCG5640 [Ipomoea batatas]GMD42081.1 hypothetical protein Iba_chr10bCG5920 [Ipomoea batatas]
MTSRSSWIAMSMSWDTVLRLPADHRRVTVPVKIDQKDSINIAAKAQNLYRDRPNTTEPGLSFFECAIADDVKCIAGDDTGKTLSPFIASRFGYLIPAITKRN